MTFCPKCAKAIVACCCGAWLAASYPWPASIRGSISGETKTVDDLPGRSIPVNFNGSVALASGSGTLTSSSSSSVVMISGGWMPLQPPLANPMTEARLDPAPAHDVNYATVLHMSEHHEDQT